MNDLSNQPALKSPLDRLLSSAALSIERLPVLKQVFARSAEALGEAYRTVGPKELQLAIDYAETGRACDLLGIHAACTTAVLDAPAWDGKILAGIDRACMLAMVGAMFGADGGEPPVADDRPLTSVELNVSRWLLEQAAAALSLAFSDVAATPMAVERLEPRLDLAPLGGEATPVVVAKYNLKIPSGVGRLFVAIPQAAIVPFRAKLERLPARKAPAVDPVWAERFKSQIRRAGVEIKAFLGSCELTLGDVAAFRPGQIIKLDRSSGGRVRVECKEQPLFWCEMGQADGFYTLRIADFVDHEREFMDDILPH